MNRIDYTLAQKSNLNAIYTTAGFPNLNDTPKSIQLLSENKADIIIVVLPFSDPLAGSPTLQESEKVALQNGMTTKLFFEQLKHIRKQTTKPILISGYLNPIYQYGVKDFCKKCAQIDIDGLIIPDLPLSIFKSKYQQYFTENNLKYIPFISPQTSESRIKEIDNLAGGFIYTIAPLAENSAFSEKEITYFKYLKALKLKTPLLIDVGMADNKQVEIALSFFKGRIISDAYVNFLSQNTVEKTADFIKSYI